MLRMNCKTKYLSLLYFCAGFLLASFGVNAQNAAPSFRIDAPAAQLNIQNQDSVLLNSFIVITNTSQNAIRIFYSNSSPPSASDNRGHSFRYENISGVFSCRGPPNCLTASYLQDTEQSATFINPGQSITVSVRFQLSGRPPADRMFGNLYSVSLLLWVQSAVEERSAAGSRIFGGQWRSASFGFVNAPLRTIN